MVAKQVQCFCIPFYHLSLAMRSWLTEGKRKAPVNKDCSTISRERRIPKADERMGANRLAPRSQSSSSRFTPACSIKACNGGSKGPDDASPPPFHTPSSAQSRHLSHFAEIRSTETAVVPEEISSRSLCVGSYGPYNSRANVQPEHLPM